MFLKEVPISQFMKKPVMPPSQTSSSVDDIIGDEYTKAANTQHAYICMKWPITVLTTARGLIHTHFTYSVLLNVEFH